jgi:hypothetical protein
MPSSRSPRSQRVHPDHLETVGEIFRQRFTSQQALASLTDCGREVVNKFLNGKPVDRSYFQKLSKHLDLDPIVICQRQPGQDTPQEEKEENFTLPLSERDQVEYSK